jgi:hypothetical protein
MALKVKCKCGTALKVPSAMADKKISCPGCEKSFVIPTARFHATPKAAASSAALPAKSAAIKPPARAAAVSVPAAKQLVPTVRTQTDPQPISFDEELSSLSIEGQSESSADLLYGLSGESAFSISEAPLPAIKIDRVAPAVSYAAEERPRQWTRTGHEGSVTGPRRGYWRDAFFSFIYPFRSGGNIVNFCVISFVTLLTIPLSGMGVIVVAPSIIIFGWIRSMYLSVVQDTAAGSDDMPGIKMEDGFLEDIIKPALRYIGAYACAMAPAVSYMIAAGTGLLPHSLASPIVFLLWLAVGILLWPMYVLLFAFGASSHVTRIDLIFTTIFRTFLPYLALWIMLMLVGLLSTLPLLAVIVGILGLNMNIPEIPTWGGVAGRCVMEVLDVYFSIVSMRIIGLYYLHYKNRFTLTFE